MPSSSAFADSDLSVVDKLAEELARLRGVGSSGAIPTLDHFHDGDGGVGDSSAPEVEEALERMKTEMLAAKELAVQGDRAALQRELIARDQAARDERDALNGYLEQLRSRQDETGDAIRSSAFATDVDELAQRARDGGYDVSSAGGGVDIRDGGSSADVAKIIQHVNDPATFDALLEVQRLDEAIQSTERKQADQAATFLTEAGDEKRPPPPLPSSDVGPSVKTTDPTQSEPIGSSMITVTALNEEIGRLKEIEAGAPAASASSPSQTSAVSSSTTAGGHFTVGGRRCVGGVWISVADEARVEALLADVSGEAEGSEAEQCPDGQGYRPQREKAERLAAIDAALEALSVQRAFVDDGHLLHTEPEPLPLGSESYLGEMKLQRAEAATLGRIGDRLAALHSTPSAEPASTEVEVRMLTELLASVRQEAERAVDSRPSTGRPLSARIFNAQHGREILKSPTTVTDVE